jgi:hypothetical protein
LSFAPDGQESWATLPNPESKSKKETSPMLLKEHRFKCIAGTETYLFKIEELVRGLAIWPHRFRLRVAASPRWEAKTFYGASCYEVAEKAADFIAQGANAGQTGMDKESQYSQGPTASPPRTLQIQE